jgi:hypothetical protein
MPRVGDCGAARQAARGSERDAANRVRVQMRKNFDNHGIIRAGGQDMENRGNPLWKACVDHAAADGFDGARIRPRIWRGDSH